MIGMISLLVLVGIVLRQSSLEQKPQTMSAAPSSSVIRSGDSTTTTGVAEHVFSTSYKDAEVRLSSGKTFTLSIPKNYRLSVVAEGYRKPRFMAKSPDGRLFIGEMYAASDTTKGRILILDNYDTAQGRFTKTTTYLDHLRNPNSLAFYRDDTGQTWLYIALTDQLLRYKYTNGDRAPTGTPEVVVRFPDQGRSWAEGGWHLTRTVLPHEKKIYVSVGSSCNSCEEKADEPSRASIIEMNPDGSDVRVYANGLRNAVGLAFVGDQLFATNNGPDHLGSDRPEDMFYRISADAHYGWPYCYELNGQVLPDTTQPWKHPVDCRSVPRTLAPMPPHSAPLGVDVFQDHFVIALHGSGKKSIGTGYEVVAVPFQGKAVRIITSGFLKQGTVFGRPAGILTNDDRSFFITDDFNGAVYLLERES